MGIFKKTDIWRCALLRAPLAEILQPGGMNRASLTLLPETGSWQFLADPFGLWRNGRLYVFAEYYDYRTHKGVIETLVYDSSLQLQDRAVVLEEDWHLSYPFVFEEDGQIYMLPEGYKSGRLTLYQAVDFPWKWEPVPQFHFPHAAIDPTLLKHAGHWWIFWTPGEPHAGRQRDLHVSRAENLMGPWQDLGLLHSDRKGGRAGGTPWHENGEICLPVQDCSQTYGGAIRILHISGFESGELKARGPGEPLPKPPALAALYPDGMHTLAAAGDITLIDVKKVQPSLKVRFFKLRRRLKKGFAKCRGRS